MDSTLQHNPMHIFWVASSTEFNGSFSCITVSPIYLLPPALMRSYQRCVCCILDGGGGNSTAKGSKNNVYLPLWKSQGPNEPPQMYTTYSGGVCLRRARGGSKEGRRSTDATSWPLLTQKQPHSSHCPPHLTCVGRLSLLLASRYGCKYLHSLMALASVMQLCARSRHFHLVPDTFACRACIPPVVPIK